ncbi:hypothetical protein SARC_10715 [Sphaeroforma arctica JP610]|uniref:Transcription factor CBF/NF-Y/archaeal histone domain-containing protein n=1 Tax=Sphaeroforma arctica JP610 TaxID=667725 RepID=A0A0L0FLA8_9EUKA|nr:hypothetical protein SARC_10715 [Sphaeroforma arctica JP610]KNC76803.1 hypothetical protein SARC_10715 [Sphaeroforma arctica JP610]|eukprot:XP_014150705.1 hypothetical protein SARC_10715 [Sphaeroforma arctica JP610]
MKKKYNARFPVMRVKRIMQTDEDVGKVAMATPVVISKTLETFLEDIILKTADVARRSGSKRMGAAHLKEVITSTPPFDFLVHLTEEVAGLPPGQLEPSTEVVGIPMIPIEELSPSISAKPRGLEPPLAAGPRKRGRPPKVKVQPEDASAAASALQAMSSSVDSFSQIPKIEESVIMPLTSVDTGGSRPMSHIASPARDATMPSLSAPADTPNGTGPEDRTPLSPALNMDIHTSGRNSPMHADGGMAQTTTLHTRAGGIADTGGITDLQIAPDERDVVHPRMGMATTANPTAQDKAGNLRSAANARHQPWMTEVTDSGSTNRPLLNPHSGVSDPPGPADAKLPPPPHHIQDVDGSREVSGGTARPDVEMSGMGNDEAMQGSDNNPNCGRIGPTIGVERCTSQWQGPTRPPPPAVAMHRSGAQMPQQQPQQLSPHPVPRALPTTHMAKASSTGSLGQEHPSYDSVGSHPANHLGPGQHLSHSPSPSMHSAHRMGSGLGSEKSPYGEGPGQGRPMFRVGSTGGGREGASPTYYGRQPPPNGPRYSPQPGYAHLGQDFGPGPGPPPQPHVLNVGAPEQARGSGGGAPQLQDQRSQSDMRAQSMQGQQASITPPPPPPTAHLIRHAPYPQGRSPREDDAPPSMAGSGQRGMAPRYNGVAVDGEGSAQDGQIPPHALPYGETGAGSGMGTPSGPGGPHPNGPNQPYWHGQGGTQGSFAVRTAENGYYGHQDGGAGSMCMDPQSRGNGAERRIESEPRTGGWSAPHEYGNPQSQQHPQAQGRGSVAYNDGDKARQHMQPPGSWDDRQQQGRYMHEQPPHGGPMQQGREGYQYPPDGLPRDSRGSPHPRMNGVRGLMGQPHAAAQYHPYARSETQQQQQQQQHAPFPPPPRTMIYRARSGEDAYVQDQSPPMGYDQGGPEAPSADGWANARGPYAPAPAPGGGSGGPLGPGVDGYDRR